MLSKAVGCLTVLWNIITFNIIIVFTVIFFLIIIFCHFHLYHNRTDHNWQEANWKRDRGGIWKGPHVRIGTRDACSATALYVDALPTRLSMLTLRSILINLIGAVKRLIASNRIQNKSFCLHNMCVCIVYIYYVYINTHTYIIYFENIYMYIFI